MKKSLLPYSPLSKMLAIAIRSGAFALLGVLMMWGGGDVWGQTAPGGVDVLGMRLWVKPDAGTCGTNNCSMTGATAWIDQSTVGNDGVASGTGNRNYREGTMNFNPSVEVNGDGYIEFNRDISDSMSIFLVFRTTQAGGESGGWWDAPAILSNQENMATDDWGIGMHNGQVFWAHDAANNRINANAGSYRDNAPHLVTITRAPSGPVTASMNGLTAVSTSGDTGTLNGNSIMRAGRSADVSSGNANFAGHYGDIITFNRILSSNEIAQINTYLAIKYGITLGHNYRGPFGGAPLYTISGYPSEIFGIARFDTSGLYQRQSQNRVDVTNTSLQVYRGTYTSTFPTTNSANSDTLADGQALMFGHTGQSAAFTKSYAGVPNRLLGREYQVTNTQDVDTVTLVFNNSVFTSLTPGGTYYMVFSTNQIFDVTDSLIPLQEVGNGNDWYVQFKFPGSTSPIPTTSYFSLLEGQVIAPAGIGKGLQMWIRADTGLDANPVTAWEDLSENSRDLTNQNNSNALIDSAGLNFGPFVDNPAGNFARDFMTSASNMMDARTIFIVGKATGGGNNDDYVGIYSNSGNTGEGFQVDGGGLVQRAGQGGASFVNPGGSVSRQNGNTLAANADISNWSIMTGMRGGGVFNGRFSLGAFTQTTDVLNSYSFAEAIVYHDDKTVGPGKSAREYIESYLAIKYGITLGHNYYASDTSLIYDITGYVNDIIGIGRDDVTLLNQKQSRSVEQDGIIEIGLGDIVASNAANSSAFSMDRTFFICGNDGGGACWSDADLVVPIEPNLHIRIAREWKYSESLGGTGNVIITLDTANTSFNFPDIPADASGYYFYHDDDGDFTNGGVTATAMALDASGKYRVSFSPSGSGYFTFGTRINPATTTGQSFCPGDVATFIGSHLASTGLCSRISMTGPNSYFLTDTSTLGFLLVPINGNQVSNGVCLDTVTWTVPSLSVINSGTYNLTPQTAPGCAGYTANNNLRQLSIGIGSPIPTDIQFQGVGIGVDSIYRCIGDTNEIINVNVGAPGAFSMGNSTTGLGINQLLTYSTDTIVNIHYGTIGEHKILFTPSGAGCSSYDSLWISIDTLKPTSFAYGAAQVCQAFGSYPVTVQPVPSGGIFKTIPPATGPAIINPSTGAFNTMNADTGVYVVVYTPPSDSGCFAQDTVLLRVVGEEAAVFNYPGNPFCLNDSNPIPQITYIPPNIGVGFRELNNTPGISINAATGEIDLANSIAGTYDIIYELSGTCVQEPPVSVTLNNTPSPNFTILPQVCQSQGTLSPTGVVGTVDHWSEWTGNVDINPSTGVINLLNSNTGGPFPITMHAIAPSTGCRDSITKPLTIVGLIPGQVAYPSAQYCKNDSNPSPVFNGTSGGGVFTSNPPTASLNPTTGLINLATIGAPATYAISYKQTFGTCTDSIFVQSITVDSVPNPFFSLDTSITCAGNVAVGITYAVPLTGQAGVYNGGNFVPGAVSGNAIDVSALQPNTTYEVRNSVTTTAGCKDTLVDYLTVLPLKDATFVYDPDTICDNYNDPTPLIVGNGGGTFWADNVFNPNTSVNATTGVIDLSASQNGTHIIYYATQGPCADTTSFVAEILSGFEAFFSYEQNSICTSDSFLYTDSVTTPGIGTFAQSGGTGLVVDPQTGTIDLLASSITGTQSYSVSHTVGQQGTCTDVHSVPVSITAFDNLLAISYPQDTFCQSSTDAAPAIVSSSGSNPPGSFNNVPGITFSTGNPGTISFNQSTPGQYVIQFEKDGICNETASTTLFISPDDDSTFSYGVNGAVCYTAEDSSLFPSLPPGSSGTFSWTSSQASDSLVFVNTSTGEIDISASDPGIYQIFYMTNGICPTTGVNTLRVNEKPSVGAIRVSPDSLVCDSQLVSFSLNGTPGGTVIYFLNGAYQTQSPIWSFDGFADQDTVEVVVENTFGCADTAQVVMTITDKPAVRIRQRPGVLTGADPIEIEIGPTLPQTLINWWVTTGDSISVDSTQGVTQLLNVNEFELLTNNINLESDYIPDSIIYYFVAESRGCVSEKDSIIIYVNPNQFPIFVPEVFTPDGNGLNDTWKIQWRSDLRPEDFLIDLYNPSGGRVYQMNPLTDQWTGETLPDGVYWWVLKNLVTGEVELSGGVTIRRR